jgi:hypothetical protein
MKPRTRISLTLSTAAAATALAFSGCGDDDGGGGTNPAALAPPDTPLYVEGAIRPEGELQTDTEAAIEAVSGFNDPGTRLIDLIDQGLAEDTDLTYEEDIEPWLGERGAVAVTSFENDEAFAVIVETTDSGAAEDFLSKAAETEEDVREASYEGADYQVDQDGFAVGLVDDFLVGGDEKIFKQIVDTSGGDSLAEDSTFEDTVDAAPAESLVDVYVDIEDAIRAAGDQVDPAALQAIEASIGDLSGKTILASLIPSGETIELDFSTNLEAPFEPGDVSELLGSVPADSWLAVGAADLGAAIEQGLEQSESAGIPREQLERQLREAGVNLERDILSWPEDFVAFVGGSDLNTLGGALIVTSGDPAASRDAVEKLVDVAVQSDEPGVKRLSVPGGAGLEARDRAELGPQPLQLVAKGDRVVLGYGAEATEQALEGGGATLSGAPIYQEAVAALGEGVDLSGFLSVAPVLEFAEAVGAAGDSGYQEAKPYLERFSYLVFGTGTEGDLTITKIVLGLQGE